MVVNTECVRVYVCELDLKETHYTVIVLWNWIRQAVCFISRPSFQPLNDRSTAIVCKWKKMAFGKWAIVVSDRPLINNRFHSQSTRFYQFKLCGHKEKVNRIALTWLSCSHVKSYIIACGLGAPYHSNMQTAQISVDLLWMTEPAPIHPRILFSILSIINSRPK